QIGKRNLHRVGRVCHYAFRVIACACDGEIPRDGNRRQERDGRDSFPRLLLRLVFSEFGSLTFDTRFYFFTHQFTLNISSSSYSEWPEKIVFGCLRGGSYPLRNDGQRPPLNASPKVLYCICL